MSINERIQIVIDNVFNGSTNRLANTIGVKPSVISGYTGKRQSKPSYEVLESMVANANISPNWLLTGNGDMLINTSKAAFCETKTTTPLEIKPIGDFKVSEKAVDFQKVPLYELEATAGIFAQGDLTPYVIDYISIPNAPKCDGAILARGDSMEPIIKSGDLLLYKEHDINNIMYGHMYIVDFDLDGDSMIVVKYIKKDKDPKRIVLESENPRYQPMDIALEQVRHIAMVKVSVAFHTMM